ncbi:endoplasmic reticulum vescicle transporter [Chloropicon primus]|nr:endoplasmic reticulum vescicle transporter [Chloropicon primus]
MNGLARHVASLSAYRKTDEHLTRRTLQGALVTVLGVLAALTLFVYETSNFKRKQVVQQMVVDSVRGEVLKARLNVSTLAIPCSVLTVNTLDQSGAFNFNLHRNLVKEVLDPSGRPAGKYQLLESELAAFALGVEASMFLTEKDQARIKDEIARKEGCRVSGDLDLQKLSGKFHISSNALIMQMLVEAYKGVNNMNTSHVIHEVALGEPYPGSVNPLDQYHRIIESPGSYKYYLQVVPTEYVYLNRSVVHTFQYSVTEYFTKFGDDMMKLPGIHFKYDMSAIAVKLREKKVSFLHYLTRLCATIGGAFALTSLINSWVG